MSTLSAGFLLIDKPTGPTSHDVVDVVRRRLGRKIKVGHAGTLDPLASGLLILGVGAATKQLSQLIKLDKTYLFTVRLGASSATDDAEGPITVNPNVKILMPNEVEYCLQSFLGAQNQIPPVFSAKKQGGVPLYKKARLGERVFPEPQRVTIYSLELKRYSFPELDLAVTCSSGTYVRALARDIGRALHTGGYVTNLRRTAVGPFRIEDSHSLDETLSLGPDSLLTPVADTLRFLVSGSNALTDDTTVLS